MTAPIPRLLVLCLLLIPVCALGASSPSDSGRSNGSALAMYTGVRWCRGAQLGLFRVVVAPDGDSRYQRMTVEVLQTDVAQRDVTVIDRFPIVETQGQRLTFEALQLKPAENYTCDDALVEGVAVRDGARGSSREKLRLRISSTGHYALRFQPSSE